MYWRFSIIMIPILFKLTYKFNEFPSKAHIYFYNIWQANSKIYMEIQRAKNSEDLRKNKVVVLFFGISRFIIKLTYREKTDKSALKWIISVPQKAVIKKGKKSSHSTRRYLKCHITTKSSHSRIYNRLL